MSAVTAGRRGLLVKLILKKLYILPTHVCNHFPGSLIIELRIMSLACAIYMGHIYGVDTNFSSNKIQCILHTLEPTNMIDQ